MPEADMVRDVLPNPGLTPIMLNHAAWVTHNVDATADFYMRIMGMELASTVVDERVPSTGDHFPYFHIFFRMADGSTIAFFDCPGLPQRSPVPHPAYDIFDHFAFEAADKAEVDRWHAWLTQNGIPVVGPTDHDGLIYSIYFVDPNGLRLEITTPTDPNWNRHTDRGKEVLAWWSEGKRQAIERGEDLAPAMIKLIRESKATRKVEPLG
jgi:catechol 2,3-dioxygenase-like lactoylglutathione lyase family enzyme